MAPFYEVLMLTKSGTDAAGKLKTLLTNSAKLLWERGAVIADVTPWGHRELAFRIRAQNKNHYDAQYTSLHVHCSPRAGRRRLTPRTLVLVAHSVARRAFEL